MSDEKSCRWICACGAEFDTKREWADHYAEIHHQPRPDGEKQIFDDELRRAEAMEKGVDR